jgi:hypothetical protein
MGTDADGFTGGIIDPTTGRTLDADEYERVRDRIIETALEHHIKALEGG